MKELFSQFISLICVVAAILGVVKWKTDWLDREAKKEFKKDSEAYYIDKIAKRLNGRTEVIIEGGRIDIVTDKFAIEVERASKWKDAIGQALWYAYVPIKNDHKKRKPKIILLMRKNDQDQRYFIMLNTTLKAYDLEIEVDQETME